MKSDKIFMHALAYGIVSAGIGGAIISLNMISEKYLEGDKKIKGLTAIFLVCTAAVYGGMQVHKISIPERTSKPEKK